MSFEAERRTLEKRLADNFTSYPVRWHNQPFKQPENSPWVAMTVLPGEGRQASIGSARSFDRFTGIVQIDIYSPENSSLSTALGIGDTLNALWNKVDISVAAGHRISTKVPYILSLGNENGWHRYVFTVPYQRTILS